MIHLKLRQVRLVVNYKRVERLYQEAQLRAGQAQDGIGQVSPRVCVPIRA